MRYTDIDMVYNLEPCYRPGATSTIASQVFESMNTLRLMHAGQDVPVRWTGCPSVTETCDRQGWREVEQRMEQLPRWSGATLCVHGFFLFRNAPHISLKNHKLLFRHMASWVILADNLSLFFR
ncbi:MAG: hypothetical protein BMS9Abin11_1004 [Gammaproteobacteria bacterium]|nr:MAG: hypothetical protein BMS9Abin11_1004 [Gammaproteobacteria bacterium]